MRKKLLRTSFILFLGIVLIYAFYFYYSKEDITVIKTFVIGNSMLPTFSNGEHICLYPDIYDTPEDVKNSDVIGFSLKLKGNFIKRVIAIPGDSIIFGKDGNMYINGTILHEGYVHSSKKFNVTHLKLLLTQLEYYNNIVPRNMFLVMGDNRSNTIDSTSYGLIDFDHILGKVKKMKGEKCR